MSRRLRVPRELGEAISIENVLSLMVVLFVLRLLFFIPLVSIDRMSLAQAQKDEYWQNLADYLQQHGDSAADPFYNAAFGLDGHRILITETGQGNACYIESLNADGVLTVIEHRQDSGRFDAMVIKGHSSVVGYRYGILRWSTPERVWFTTGDSVGNIGREESVSMQKRFRAWTHQYRGF
ncbi:MAG TPA: hypothetical protein VLM37_12975 [Fibrobacteraceae bacterium]|nr:hypothetical protein [Fibrobacteraceae bacterium]